MLRITIFLVALSLLPPCSASALDLFVNNQAGDDRNDGRLEHSAYGGQGPVRTIGRALKLAQSGDRVIVADTGQPYREQLTLFGSGNSGSPVAPFVIEGHGAVLDGSQPVPDEAWAHYADDVFRFRPRGLAYQQLFRNDRPLAQVPVRRLSASPPRLEPLQWCLHENWIYFRVEEGHTPQSYALTSASHEVGITLYRVANVQILDLTVQGFRLDGVNAHDGVRDAFLVGLTCRGNGRSGASVGGASRLTLEACLLGNNGHAQLRTEGHCRVWANRCELLDNTAPPYVVEGGRLVVDGKPIRIEPR